MKRDEETSHMCAAIETHKFYMCSMTVIRLSVSPLSLITFMFLPLWYLCHLCVSALICWWKLKALALLWTYTIRADKQQYDRIGANGFPVSRREPAVVWGFAKITLIMGLFSHQAPAVIMSQIRLISSISGSFSSWWLSLDGYFSKLTWFLMATIKRHVVFLEDNRGS